MIFGKLFDIFIAQKDYSIELYPTFEDLPNYDTTEFHVSLKCVFIVKFLHNGLTVPDSHIKTFIVSACPRFVILELIVNTTLLDESFYNGIVI